MYRDRGIQALNVVISSEKNVKILESKVNKISSSHDDYYLIIQEVINSRREGMNCKDILKLLREGRYLESKEEYDMYRSKIEEHDKFLVKPFEVDEGVLECGRCNSNKTISYTKQTRSGDESTTVFAMCFNCNNKWKM
jgi:DNA-directed RNA polymerase subunit M/transcription elongation factor TFIIS